MVKIESNYVQQHHSDVTNSYGKGLPPFPATYRLNPEMGIGMVDPPSNSVTGNVNDDDDECDDDDDDDDVGSESLMGDDYKNCSSLLKKRKKQMVSEESKDDKYWERRRKNNLVSML